MNLPPAGDGPLDDPNQDQIPNLLAYALQVPPMSPLTYYDRLGLPSAKSFTATEGARFSFLRPVDARPDVNYIIESADSLESGPWVELARRAPGAGWTGALPVSEKQVALDRVAVDTADLEAEFVDGRVFLRLRIESAAPLP